MPRIILIANSGHHNIGDEGMITTNLIRLKRFLPDVDFLILSEDPDYTSWYHKTAAAYSIDNYLFKSRCILPTLISKSLAIVNLPLKAVNVLLRILGIDRKIRHFTFPGKVGVSLRGLILLLNARRLKEGKGVVFLNKEGIAFLDSLRDSDLIFKVGEDGLSDMYPLRGIYGKCFTYLACKILGKPVVVSGQTIGPVKSFLDRRFVRYALNGVELITLRDRKSSQILTAMGVTKPIIRVVGDDALFLPPASSGRIAEVFAQEKVEIGRPLIGISVREWPRMMRVVNVLAQIADYLVSEMNGGIVFVPMQFPPETDDRAAASKVRDLMTHQNQAHIIANEYDAQALKGLVGELDLVISTRYHLVVFATTMQVPSIALFPDQHYSIKMNGILQMMGQDKYACDAQDISFSKLRLLVEDAFSNKEQIRKELGRRLKDLREVNLFAVRYTAKLLEIADCSANGMPSSRLPTTDSRRAKGG